MKLFKTGSKRLKPQDARMRRRIVFAGFSALSFLITGCSSIGSSSTDVLFSDITKDTPLEVTNCLIPFDKPIYFESTDLYGNNPSTQETIKKGFTSPAELEGSVCQEKEKLTEWTSTFTPFIKKFQFHLFHKVQIPGSTLNNPQEARIITFSDNEFPIEILFAVGDEFTLLQGESKTQGNFLYEFDGSNLNILRNGKLLYSLDLSKTNATADVTLYPTEMGGSTEGQVYALKKEDGSAFIMVAKKTYSVNDKGEVFKFSVGSSMGEEIEGLKAKIVVHKIAGECTTTGNPVDCSYNLLGFSFTNPNGIKL